VAETQRCDKSNTAAETTAQTSEGAGTQVGATSITRRIESDGTTDSAASNAMLGGGGGDVIQPGGCDSDQSCTRRRKVSGQVALKGYVVLLTRVTTLYGRRHG